MGQPIENVCCRQQPCISTTDFFASVILDTNVLSVAIDINRSDVFADDPDYSSASYRKAAYCIPLFGLLSKFLCIYYITFFVLSFVTIYVCIVVQYTQLDACLVRLISKIYVYII